jgi:HK97 family phage prohead protease
MTPSPGAYTLETFRSNFAVRKPAADEGQAAARNTFRGMASVYHTLIDAWMPTRILPGAFTRTLADLNAVSRVKILYQHNQDMPIGVPTSMIDGPSGLEVEGRISDTTLGRDAMVLLEDGVISELSIGFTPTKQQFVIDPATKLEERHILDLDLFEFSLVTFAANRDAKIMSVHSLMTGLSPELQRLVGPLVEKLRAAVREDQTEPLIALAPLAAVLTGLSEAHAGKVLSAKNQQLVSD